MTTASTTRPAPSPRATTFRAALIRGSIAPPRIMIPAGAAMSAGGRGKRFSSGRTSATPIGRIARRRSEKPTTIAIRRAAEKRPTKATLKKARSSRALTGARTSQSCFDARKNMKILSHDHEEAKVYSIAFASKLAPLGGLAASVGGSLPELTRKYIVYIG